MVVIEPTRLDAYQLLHDGALALSDVSSYGIRIDMDYCETAHAEISVELDNLVDQLHRTPDMKKWERTRGRRLDLSTNEQVASLLYDQMGIEPPEGSGRSVKKDVLGLLEPDWIPDLLRWRRLTMARGTFLNSILREAVDGYLHPFFKLQGMITYRSSCSNPNFQNMPIRDPEIGQIIRRSFIPRPGNCILELDYSGAEVRVAACYHQDPTMIQYILDPDKDMHRDSAGDCYLLPPEVIDKAIRFSGKNDFVFPEFYGSYWKNVAKSLWRSAADLVIPWDGDPQPMKEHLAAQEVRMEVPVGEKDGRTIWDWDTRRLDNEEDFSYHIRMVEKRMWNKRFPVYRDWKLDWFAEYERTGFIDMKTGFRCGGSMGRNDCVNYPVQGAAFHCLLQSLVSLNGWLAYNKFGAAIIGQIHDSIVLDVPEKEVDDVVAAAVKIMGPELQKKWPWIVVPMEVEAELAPVDRSWHDKKEIKLAA
jgi:DNA polymerase I-like protein with 3'-5' exonuclease and polymerase domains